MFALQDDDYQGTPNPSNGNSPEESSSIPSQQPQQPQQPTQQPPKAEQQQVQPTSDAQKNQQQPADNQQENNQQTGKPKPKTGLLLTFMGLFLFLFLLFMVFVVVILFQDGGNNPLLGALGVEPALLRDLLQTLISLVFGFLSLITFIAFLIGLFRRFTATKIEVKKKKQSVIIAAVSGILMIVFVFVWILLYFYLDRLQIGGSGAAVILTEPQQTTNLTAPIAVTFDAIEIQRLYTREGIVSYAWDLDGDGEFDDGNGRAIQYEYNNKGNNEGIYNVSVKVTLADAREVVTQRLVTIANVLPVADISYRPQILEVPVEVTFDASGSRDPDGNIIGYEWDLDGDGAADEQGQQVSFLYEEAVQVPVTLVLTDNQGQTVEEQLLLDLRQGRTRQAVIIARPGLSGQAPFAVSFDGSNSFAGERIQSYEWDFGDGSVVAQGRLAQHTYREPGEYTVLLTVTSADGTRLEGEETVVVQRQTNNPTARIELDSLDLDNDGVLRGEAPLQVSVDASNSEDRDGGIVEYRWDFDGDDVTDAVGQKAAHTYVDAGVYTMVLTVVDDDDLIGTEEIEVEVEVPTITVDLQVDTFSGPIPLEVTFDATGSRADDARIISYTWNFGDGSTEVIGSARQTHVFQQVGEYQVSVELLTDSGDRAEESITVVAREVELQADFSFNPEEVATGNKIFFDATSSQGQISRYYWEFGDGQISRVVKPDHSYQQPGTYEVLLEVYDRNNRVSRKTVEVEILAP